MKIRKEIIDSYNSMISYYEESERQEYTPQEIGFLAFFMHLSELGRNKDIRPNLVRGDTTISIPAYFALKGHGTNPINKAALGLLPDYSYRPVYHNSTQTIVDDSGLISIKNVPKDEIQAGRKGRAAQFIVANALGLLSEEAQGQIGSRPTNIRQAIKADIARDIPRDLNEASVGEVSDIASEVKQKGYVDFLDYLVDAKQIISERVDIIFSQEIPLPPAE